MGDVLIVPAGAGVGVGLRVSRGLGKGGLATVGAYPS